MCNNLSDLLFGKSIVTAKYFWCSDDSSLSWAGLAWSLGTVRQSYLKRCWLLSEKKGDLSGDHRFTGRAAEEVSRAGMKPCSWGRVVLSGKCLLSPENLVTVIGEVCSLLGVERADILGKFNAPLLQRLLNAGLGTQQVAGVSEGNPATVEQLVYVRGEQQAVVPIQAFGVVVALRPGLDVAGNKQGLGGDAGDPAGRFNRLEVIAEEALAYASFGELQLLCDFQG